MMMKINKNKHLNLEKKKKKMTLTELKEKGNKKYALNHSQFLNIYGNNPQRFLKEEPTLLKKRNRKKLKRRKILVNLI